MECINPLLTLTTTATQTSSTTTTQHAWKQQQLQKNNCHCLKRRSYDSEQCDLNTCPSNLLLQGSDDPMIGHGANSVLDDDHPMELRTLQLQQQQLVQPMLVTTSATNWSNMVKEKLKNKTQAKVQEKLNKNILMQFQNCKKEHNLNNKLRKQQQQQVTKPAHENVRSWLKSIVDMQNNATTTPTQEEQKEQHIEENLTENNFNNLKDKHSINYNDLPYMGEITLDNSRPRRGRKPKKANICHLIYKNYGTIILGEPKKNCVCNKACVCKLSKEIAAAAAEEQETPPATKIDVLPLNLCLRDQYDAQQEDTVKVLKQQHKSKRSTIFIPPKVNELAGSSSPSVEVSIGKFKFTGGVNPLLQKKKMLSVDSVGNYIYFDGNDSKMLHVSEKLPHQQQQQQQTFPKCLNKLPQQQTTETAEILTPIAASTRKRKLTRRSEQRERLEKSFKEQGFLIQTEQMQSSEGATYCKFRQLKKFTRYLFRNWKDYLPNELKHEQQQQEQPSTTSPNYNKTEHTENA